MWGIFGFGGIGRLRFVLWFVFRLVLGLVFWLRISWVLRLVLWLRISWFRRISRGVSGFSRVGRLGIRGFRIIRLWWITASGSRPIDRLVSGGHNGGHQGGANQKHL